MGNRICLFLLGGFSYIGKMAFEAAFSVHGEISEIGGFPKYAIC